MKICSHSANFHMVLYFATLQTNHNSALVMGSSFYYLGKKLGVVV